MDEDDEDADAGTVTEPKTYFPFSKHLEQFRIDLRKWAHFLKIMEKVGQWSCLACSDEDIDAIVDDDGTFKRPPLRKGALIPDQQTKQLIRNAIAKAGM